MLAWYVPTLPLSEVENSQDAHIRGSETNVLQGKMCQHMLQERQSVFHLFFFCCLQAITGTAAQMFRIPVERADRSVHLRFIFVLCFQVHCWLKVCCLHSRWQKQ